VDSETDVDLIQAIILGVVEGLTEFLPVSSTGHLTIAEKMLGLDIDDKAVTAFTAVIQTGAIAAVVVFFRADIWRIILSWCRGVVRPEYRGDFDHRMGWYIIVGSLPIGVAGLLGRNLVTGPLRNLWWVAGSLVGWSFVLVYAEIRGGQQRAERDLTMRDAIVIGLVQCVALIPGVSRSGATISAGMFRGLDRVAATRISFLLSIPALVAAGLYEMKDVGGSGIGLTETLTATVVSFVVAYAAVAWLLRFVAHHSMKVFAVYRVAVGLALALLLTAGIMTAR
jgi:undecaprenyl-diphosphatase